VYRNVIKVLLIVTISVFCSCETSKAYTPSSFSVNETYVESPGLLKLENNEGFNADFFCEIDYRPKLFTRLYFLFGVDFSADFYNIQPGVNLSYTKGFVSKYFKLSLTPSIIGSLVVDEIIEGDAPSTFNYYSNFGASTQIDAMYSLILDKKNQLSFDVQYSGAWTGLGSYNELSIKSDDSYSPFSSGFNIGAEYKSVIGENTEFFIKYTIGGEIHNSLLPLVYDKKLGLLSVYSSGTYLGINHMGISYYLRYKYNILGFGSLTFGTSF
jgi:hypothetical protein